ncbi:MAG: hypothetical protein H0U60_20100 [Blastocatellia bacterium]|nr:hypothetical protein [Blastocatellia bacterium]
MLTKPVLDLLFVAEHTDGLIVKQTQEDVSATDPTRSAFYDVHLDRVKTLSLVRGDETVASVDLETGKFTVGNVTFDTTDQSFVKDEPLKLIYFRETQVHKGVDIESNQVTQTHLISRYFIGWETTDRFGKKVKQTIAIN